jgi:hypothetical protein
LGLAGAGPIRFEVVLKLIGSDGYLFYRLCDGELNEFEKKMFPGSIPIRIEIERRRSTEPEPREGSNVRKLEVKDLDFWRNKYEGVRRSLVEDQREQTATSACYMCGRVQW